MKKQKSNIPNLRSNVMISVHDNTIISYQVNFEKEEIQIHTLTELGKNVYIVFSGVLAHFFETQTNNSIIFSIDQHQLLDFCKENKELLEQQKSYGWPIFYEDIKELEETLIKGNYFYYNIYASLGLNGWVLAKKLEILDSY
nr:hypothetical protein [Bacillus pseudomycoides]